MKVVDFTGMSFEKGQRLKVVDETGTFYGKFDKFAINNSRLDLKEVTYEDGRPCGRFRYFHKQYVRLVEDADNRICKPEQDKKSQEQQTSSMTEKPQQRVSLTEKQLEHIMKTIKEPVMVNQPGSVYFSALADIYKHLTVGVAVEKTHSGRLTNIKKLAISTSNQLYIFDLQLLNANKTMRDLKELFESENYLKLFFDCRMLLDNLKTSFDITVESAFDLMLAAAQFYPKDEVSELAGCTKAVLGVTLPKFPTIRQETLAAFLPAIHQKIINSHFTQDFHRKFKQFISPDKSISGFYSKFKPNDSKDSSFDQSVVSGIKEIDFSIYDSNQEAFCNVEK